MKYKLLIIISIFLSTYGEEIQWGEKRLNLQAGLRVDEVINSESSYLTATLFIINSSEDSVKIMSPLFRGYYSLEYKAIEYDTYS